MEQTFLCAAHYGDIKMHTIRSGNDAGTVAAWALRSFLPMFRRQYLDIKPDELVIETAEIPAPEGE
jgi:hypothetical protein